MEAVWPFKMNAKNMSNNWTDEVCIQCSETDDFGMTYTKINDEIKIIQCMAETHHPDQFIFKRGEQYITRTMCVENPPANCPTKIYFDKTCEGVQEVNIFKPQTDFKDIKDKTASRILKTVKATCQEALSL